MTTSSPRALVVEDDRSWQQILSEILADAGLAVDVAEGLEAAVPLMCEQSHRVAVIDLSLAGNDHRNQDGLQVLRALRRHDPRCVALLVTGFATVEIAVSALREYGAFTCLRKETFSRAEFRSLVRQALAFTGVVTEALQPPCAPLRPLAPPCPRGGNRGLPLGHRPDDGLSTLTAREREVLDLLAQGMTNKEIALQLVITAHTVKRHLKAIFEKMDVHTRAAATARAMEERRYLQRE